VVCSGSIDRLGQSELALLIENRSLSKLSQGITTEITGEGASAAAQNQRTLAQLQPGLDQYHLKVDWTTLAEYFARLEKSGTPLKHRNLRGRIANPGSNPGDRIESLHPQELDQMKALVEQAMQAGAFGLPPLEQAIRKITSLPAQRERLRDRGLLKEGYFADATISIQ
jgi:N-acyl-D-amino-acid deacylase